MKDFLDYIKDYIKAELPLYKTVELYNNQIFASNVDRSEKAFPYPAVFIELIPGEIHNRALGIKDIVLEVTFHFAFEGYKFNHGENMLSALDDFDAQVLRLRSDDDVYFSSFQNTGELFDTDNDNVEEPTLTYFTVFRHTTAHKTLIENQLQDIEVDGEII